MTHFARVSEHVGDGVEKVRQIAVVSQVSTRAYKPHIKAFQRVWADRRKPFGDNPSAVSLNYMLLADPHSVKHTYI